MSLHGDSCIQVRRMEQLASLSLSKALSDPAVPACPVACPASSRLLHDLKSGPVSDGYFGAGHQGPLNTCALCPGLSVFFALVQTSSLHNKARPLQGEPGRSKGILQ